MMRKSLVGSSHLEHFFDDILIHTATWEEHLAALRDLFDRVQKAGLTLKPSKCQFACPQVDFWVIQ